MFLGFLRCLVRGHQRAARQVRWGGDTYVSVCRYCGVGMYQTSDRRRSWKADRQRRLLIEDKRR